MRSAEAEFSGSATWALGAGGRAARRCSSRRDPARSGPTFAPRVSSAATAIGRPASSSHRGAPTIGCDYNGTDNPDLVWPSNRRGLSLNAAIAAISWRHGRQGLRRANSTKSTSIRAWRQASSSCRLSTTTGPVRTYEHWATPAPGDRWRLSLPVQARGLGRSFACRPDHMSDHNDGPTSPVIPDSLSRGPPSSRRVSDNAGVPYKRAVTGSNPVGPTRKTPQARS